MDNYEINGITKENNLIDNLPEYEEYYLLKKNNIYKITIEKLKNEITIKYKNYGIKLNDNNLCKITNSILNNIDEAYELIINAFEKNKIIIKDIAINKSVKSFLNYLFIILKKILNQFYYLIKIKL